MDDWLYRTTSALPQKRLFRLALAGSFGVDERGVREGMDRGINVFMLTLRDGGVRSALRSVLPARRDDVAIVAYAGLGWFGWGVRRSVEHTLRKLKTDYLDVGLLGWLGVTTAWTNGIERELLHLRESGKLRAIGVSIHDRPRAGRLAASSPLDLLMIRYNAAHPGAERDIFPRRRGNRPTVLAYTATSWRQLLKKPAGWNGPAMSSGDCYRFQLTNPHVDLALCGPANRDQLIENLDAVARGPLTEDELMWMREYGRKVHG